MKDERHNEQAYLLRLQRVGDHRRPEWRLVLVDIITSERHGFGDPAALTTFLAERLAVLSGSSREEQDDQTTMV